MTTIVRIPSDKPLIDPTIVDLAIKKFVSGDYDYVSNFRSNTYPYGTEVEVFSFTALKNVWDNAQLASEHEHVTPYIYNNPSHFKIFNIVSKTNLSNYRWVVDYPSDFKLVEKIIQKIHKIPILMSDIIDLLKKEPDLIQINKNVRHDEGYQTSLRNDRVFIDSKDGMSH